MDAPPGDAATRIAGFLLDERDLAALAGTNRFWRNLIKDNQALYVGLLERRFGEAGGASAGAGAAAAAPDAQQRYKELASRKQAVFAAERVVWLNGMYLEVVPEPGSIFGRAVRLNHVCWLHLDARFPGVLPGHYCAAWRCRLMHPFALDDARLIATQEPAVGADEGAPAGGAGEQPAAAEAEDAPAAVQSVVNQQILDGIFYEVGGDWFELLGTPFDVAEPCTVTLSLQGHSNWWKQGIVFDSVRLRRLPPAPPLGAPPAAAHAQGQPGTGPPPCTWVPA